MDNAEREFGRWLKAKYLGWSTSIEFGLGGDPGNPDTALGEPVEWRSEDEIMEMPCGILQGGQFHAPTYWAELKVGEIKNGVLKPREVRPAQIGWHRVAQEAGQATAFLVGVRSVVSKKEDWSVFAIEARYIEEWKNGYVIGSEKVWPIEGGSRQAFSLSLCLWLRNNA